MEDLENSMFCAIGLDRKTLKPCMQTQDASAVAFFGPKISLPLAMRNNSPIIALRFGNLTIRSVF